MAMGNAAQARSEKTRSANGALSMLYAVAAEINVHLHPACERARLCQIYYHFRDVDVREITLSACSDPSRLYHRRDRGDLAGDIAAAKCIRTNHDWLFDSDRSEVAFVEFRSDAQC